MGRKKILARRMLVTCMLAADSSGGDEFCFAVAMSRFNQIAVYLLVQGVSLTALATQRASMCKFALILELNPS